MPQSLFAPALNFDFFVTMWQVKGPDLFGSSAAAGVASAAVSVAGAFLFGGFSEISGLESQMEIEEYREGGYNAGPRRFARYGGYPDLVFKRGVGYDTSLADWYFQAKSGAEARIRKDGVVLLMDRGGAGATGLGLPGIDRTPIAGWYFRNAIPKAVDGPQLNAKGNDVAIERLVLAHEGIDRISPAMLSGASGAFAAMGGALGMAFGAGLAGLNSAIGS
jgi:phage tail-like protein